MKILVRKLLLFLIFLTIFALLLIYIEPPKSWPEASNLQILIFFIPLLVISTLLANLFTNAISHSFIFGLAVVILALFQALESLNILTGTIIIAVIALLMKYFPKMRLTTSRKIPKLSRLGERK